MFRLPSVLFGILLLWPVFGPSASAFEKPVDPGQTGPDQPTLEERVEHGLRWHTSYGQAVA